MGGWSLQQQATLFRLFVQNRTYAEISRTLGKSRNAVAGKAKRMGLKADLSRRAKNKRISYGMRVAIAAKEARP